MKIARHNIFLFFAVLSAATGIWFFYDWSIEKVKLALCLLNFLPSIIFFMIYMLEKKYGSRKMIKNIINLIIVFTIVLYILFMYFMITFIPILYGIRNLSKYSSIVANDWGKDLANHFPQKIPNNVKNVKFIYRAGFMQGGAFIQLCYSTTPEEICKLHERFSKIKTKSFWGGGKYDHMKPTTYFYNGDMTPASFPKDYEIMIFDWIPSEKEIKKRGISINSSPNHGKSHGVAISKKRNIIVYWAESW